MLLLAMLLTTVPAPAAAAPNCRAAQLHLSLQDDGGGAMSHDGITVAIQNLGPDCMLPALPLIRFADARGRPLDAVRQAPVGMHPGPVLMPVRLSGGHRATTELRWVSGPVFDQNRSARAHQIFVEIGGHRLKAPLRATLYGAAGKPIGFEQPPLHRKEGMAAG